MWFEGGPAEHAAQAAPAGDLDWNSVRGAVVIDGVLFYGTTSNELFRRTFDGTNYGPATLVDPYNDPVWSNVDAGGGRLYRGVRPSFYSQISSLRGLAYQDGRLYYTRQGMAQIFVRDFVPDSGIMSESVSTVPGFSQSGLGSIFLDPAGQHLYFSNAATGTLSRVGWQNGAVSGTPTVVSGPAIDGVDWRSSGLFLANGPQPPVNQAPQAVATVECTRRSCAFDGSDSSDPDGAVEDYLWDFGDGSSTSDEVAPVHEFGADGPYTVTLTVTDAQGKSGSTQLPVDVAENRPPTAVISDPQCTYRDCTFNGSESSDPDPGEALTYTWDFGDGSATVTGPDVDHQYQADGGFTVTLTVEDEHGATASTTRSVTVAENHPPVASIAEPSCTGRTCTFDGVSSSDPDVGDSIVGYSWDFGDGSDPESGTGVTHEFASAGAYTVTLTVTDEGGATGTATVDVDVSDLLPAPGFVAKAATTTYTTNATVTVPAGVQAGDRILLFVGASVDTVPGGPVGAGAWSQQHRVTSGPLGVSVFSKVGDGTESGQSVSVTFPTQTRTDLTMVVYRGPAPIGVASVVSSTDANTSSHTSPTVAVASPNSRVLTYWADRSSATTDWTPPAGANVVSEQVGTGGGRVGTLLIDAAPPAGPYGGLVAQTNAVSGRGASLTIVLAY